MRTLEMVAPGTSLREGIDNIVDARTGALIVIGDAEELGFLFSGGIKLDVDYSPTFLYELAKMDGAIALSTNATKIVHVNVQLTPDPTILTMETGTGTARPSGCPSRRTRWWSRCRSAARWCRSTWTA